MKVLLVHNFYGTEAPSGENVVFEAEKALLERNGHSVEVFTRHSDVIRNQGLRGAIKGAASVPWNPFVAHEVLQQVENFQPDVVHAHNTFPLISPAIFRAIGRQAATVLTLHNYRLLCPAGIPMRDGKVCTDCISQRTVLPALRYGCYRNSRFATAPLAANVAMHRALGTWEQNVDAFIALSNFQQALMAEGGLPAHKIYVKPNFHPGSPTVVPYAERPGYVAFVGRLGEEKGVRTLLRAWQAWGADAPELRLVGDGPLRHELQALATGLRVRFLGQVATTEARCQIANASLLVLPSECFETFGLVAIEAFAYGTPVAASRLGPLPDIVRHNECGVLFTPANADALRRAVADTLTNVALLERLSCGARAAFDALYSEHTNYEMLMKIYQSAIEQNEIDG